MRFQGPPTSYKEATWRTVHHSPGFTVEDIAEHLGIAASTLYSMANRNMPGTELPRKHIEPIVTLTGNSAFAEYFASITKGLFVAMPEPLICIADVMAAAAAAMDETGNVLTAVAEAIKENGKIDEGRELERIERYAKRVQVEMARLMIVARREAEKQP